MSRNTGDRAAVLERDNVAINADNLFNDSPIVHLHKNRLLSWRSHQHLNNLNLISYLKLDSFQPICVPNRDLLCTAQAALWLAQSPHADSQSKIRWAVLTPKVSVSDPHCAQTPRLRDKAKRHLGESLCALGGQRFASVFHQFATFLQALSFSALRLRT